MKPTNPLINYITEHEKKRNKSVFDFNGTSVIVKDPPEWEGFSAEELAEYVLGRVPEHFLENVEIIYVGEFPILKGRNAVFSDGAIYVSHQEPTYFDMLEDIIHEVGHSLEERYNALIYTDALKNEFLSKREKLRHILKSQGYDGPAHHYSRVEYDEGFDNFLSDEVGFPALLSLTMGLFASPYGATSLREYFANGFEKYLLGDREYLKTISPVLTSIIDELYYEKES